MENSPSVNEFDEKTRVTQVSQAEPSEQVGANDCVVVIYTKEPTMLGKRIVLDQAIMRIGRGTDNNIVLDGDSVSRRHAHFERRNDAWYAVDDGSTNGTYVNERKVDKHELVDNDVITMGKTNFRFKSIN